MCRIEKIKDLMLEYCLSYWEASYVIEERLSYNEKYEMPYCFNAFKRNIISVDKNDEFYEMEINIIKEILKKEELVFLWKNISDEVCRCPECGNETGGSSSLTEQFCNPDEIIKCLFEFDFVSLSKRVTLDGEEFYCIKTYTEKEIIDDFICETCEEIACTFYNEQGDYKEGNIDGLFDMFIWSHGLSTGFSGHCDAKEIVNRIVNLDSHSEWQICCSHKAQRVGPIGVYMKGHAQFVSNIDLHSRIDSRGYRVFDPSDWGAEEGLISSPEEISLDSWDHSETILVNHKIVGIWIKKWALKDPNLKKLWDYLVPIAKDNGWVIHVCKARRE